MGGFTIIAMTFPVDVCLAVRVTVSHRYPEQTRRSFSAALYWWLFCLVLNMSGQLFLITNALLPAHFNDSVKVYEVVLMAFFMVGWIYDDYQVLTAFRHFATQDYASAWILDKQENDLPTLKVASSAVSSPGSPERSPESAESPCEYNMNQVTVQ